MTESTGGTGEIEAFSLFDPDTLTCPFPFYDKLRAEQPAYLVPELGMWLVTKYEDAVRVFKDVDHFSSSVMDKMGGSMSLNPPRESVQKILAEGYDHLNILNFADPPAHSRHRALVSQAFLPRRVASLEPTIRKIAAHLARACVEDVPVDFVKAFSAPLPIRTIGEALGVSPDDLDQFRSWSDAVTDRVGRMLSEEEDERAATKVVEFQQYMAQLIAARQAAVHDDLIGDLVAAKVDGEKPFSTEELISIVTILLVAGNDTSRNLLSLTVLELLERPELLATVRSDRSLIPALTEEVLRLHAPAHMLPRVTTEDVELGGALIPANELVLIGMGASNRDPEEFTSPEELRLDRSNARSHLAFGRGIHLCVGAALARAEIRVAMEVLLDEFSSITLAPGTTPAFEQSFLTRGLAELRVVLRR